MREGEQADVLFWCWHQLKGLPWLSHLTSLNFGFSLVKWEKGHLHLCSLSALLENWTGESCGLQGIEGMKKKRTSSKFVLLNALLYQRWRQPCERPTEAECFSGNKASFSFAEFIKELSSWKLPYESVLGPEDPEFPITVLRVCVYVCACWYMCRCASMQALTEARWQP